MLVYWLVFWLVRGLVGLTLISSMESPWALMLVYLLDWIEPPPPPLLEDLFLDFVAWNRSWSSSSADGDLLLIRSRQGRPRMDE